MNKEGRINHTSNDKQLIFVCYVVEKLRDVPQQEWRRVFASLVKGRDDAGEVRRLVWDRMK